MIAISGSARPQLPDIDPKKGGIAMYQFRPATERIQYMRELIRDRVIQTDAERALIITESYQKNEHVVPIIKRPMARTTSVSQMTVRVEDFELIVGNKAKNFLGACVNAEWAGAGWIPFFAQNWTLRKDGLLHNPDDEELHMSIDPQDLDALRSIADYWNGRTVNATAEAWKPEGYEELAKLEVSSYGAAWDS
jgi:formate C-acetyltransferase